MKPFANSIEHLREEIFRLDLMLRRAVLIAREPGPGTGPDEFRGLVVTENEVDDILRAKALLGERWERTEAKQADLTLIDQELEKRRKEIDARTSPGKKKAPLALPSLAAQFSLSPPELDILLVALAPELEPRYETLYAYLQNDVTRKHPSVDLALNLICRSEREKLAARSFLSPWAPLLYQSILELADENQDRQPSLLRKFLKVDETVVRFLLDQPPRAAGTGTLVTPEGKIDDLEVDDFTHERLKSLARHLMREQKGSPVIRLVGPSEVVLRDAAEAFCLAFEHRMLLVELGQITDESRLAKLLRDVQLWQAVLAVQSGEFVSQDAEGQRLGQSETLLWSRLRDFKEPFLLLGPPSAFLQVPREVTLWRVEIDVPNFDARHRAWNAALGEHATTAPTAQLADSFQFGPRRIRQAVNLASGLAAIRDPATPHPTNGDLLDAARALTAPQVGRFMVQIKPRYTWDDIALPPEKMRQLRSIAARIQLRRRVHGEWGFGEKLSRGKGLNVLFTGSSGTGKTMAAEILARELSLELLQIDLSAVVSKYIGETEKNLSAIFREADQSQSMLFFDEADSLFGKRTEVKDAHDRYANIEVNYLLQRIEQYEGVVVLATNLQRNLDDAFLRRIQEVVDFPFPDPALRERIWRSHFPQSAPRGDDIDFAFLGRQFKLSGGGIKNVVLSAAFLAAGKSEDASIQMSDLMIATAYELRKEGKLCTKSDFGPYYELIQQKE